MHPNPAFRRAPEARTLAFLRTRSFGTLSVNGPEGPLMSHVPFLLSGDAGTADLHLVRSNPILSALPAAAVLAATGPDGYVSPDWYGTEDQVPTWNYVAVHVRGRLARLPQAAMRDVLDRQSAGFEDRLPKPPWTADKMTPGVLDGMVRQIVPCRLEVTEIEATWKLSQNKPDDVRLRAAEAVAGGRGGRTGGARPADARRLSRRGRGPRRASLGRTRALASAGPKPPGVRPCSFSALPPRPSRASAASSCRSWTSRTSRSATSRPVRWAARRR